jgi:predicted regulator of Ras-like GTPase activity (Roadblock/LC7/MglB family)
MNAEADEIEPLSCGDGDAPRAESRVERVEAELAELRADVPEVLGAAVVSAEGFLFASTLPRDADEELIAAMAAALLGTGERVAGKVLGGELTQALVRGRLGWLVLCAIGRDAVLAALATPDARVGVVLLEAKRHAARLTRIV